MAESSWVVKKPRRHLYVVYHFLPHYRAAVFSRLLRDPRWHCRFLADSTSIGIDASIPTWADCPTHALVACPVQRLPVGCYAQWRALYALLLGQTGTCVFLSDMHAVHVWIGAILARIRGHRVLFWGHGWIRKEGLLKSLIRHIFFRCAHAVLLYGRRAKILATGRGFPRHRLHVIYNSLDVVAQRAAARSVTKESLEQFRRRFSIPGDRPTVICTSRLTCGRRLDLLIEAVAGLEHPRPAILLVGDGPERSALATMAEDRGVSVIFLGAIYEESIIAHAFACAAITVAPGKVGLTAMHSMAYGVPVLTHDDADDQMPEWEAIIPGLTGDLFEKDDVKSLRSAIRKWLAGEPQLCTRQACAAVIDRFYNPEYQVEAIARAVLGEKPESTRGERVQREEINHTQ